MSSRKAQVNTQPAEAVDGSAAALRRRNRNLKVAIGTIITIMVLGAAFLVYTMWTYGYM